ncbi:hypothetical protein BOTBODRAFT_175166 [Botryobasidium botryosum FD-172 SS1]|uniref:Protein kinase domain-containing protein n=1 Tax=Botryobasidium botryosum (strain FD-172 SS1) TaxID=930990 RepID=A0A067MES7_BOTB1|nr:hypothetical protein BOTBODRAFT_175166 [Botryobasidium botryosum FD-172 SS1]
MTPSGSASNFDFTAYLAQLLASNPGLDISERVRISGDDLEKPCVCSGGHSDLYRGVMDSNINVALKKVRLLSAVPDSVKRRFSREVRVWARLDHENVLRFLGVCKKGSFFFMVAPWIENGDALTYLQANPRADRRNLLIEAAKGLKYLHDNKIAHGDFKGGNILISDTGRALLCDFGLSKLQSVDSKTPKSIEFAGTARWMAPELLNESNKKTATADVYAFGMTITEIYTGMVPYHQIENVTDVIIKVIGGHRPDRPSKKFRLKDDMWAIAERCWRHDPNERPQMDAVLMDLSTRQRVLSPPPSA